RSLEPDQHPRQRRLAGTALADHRQRLALLQLQRHIAHRMDGRRRLSEQRAPPAEGLAQIVDDDGLAGHATAPGFAGNSGRTLSRNPVRLPGSGTPAISSLGYSCCGSRSTACVSPCSTISPSLITASRSQTWATTPKSWVISS